MFLTAIHSKNYILHHYTHVKYTCTQKGKYFIKCFACFDISYGFPPLIWYYSE